MNDIQVQTNSSDNIEIKTIEFQGQSIKALYDKEKDDFFFLTKDVCDLFGLKNPSQAIKTHCDENEYEIVESGNPKFDNISLYYQILNKARRISLISETGFYSLAYGSKTPFAKKFAQESAKIMTQIRKTGNYSTGQEIDLSNPTRALAHNSAQIGQAIAQLGQALTQVCDRQDSQEFIVKQLEKDNDQIYGRLQEAEQTARVSSQIVELMVSQRMKAGRTAGSGWQFLLDQYKTNLYDGIYDDYDKGEITLETIRQDLITDFRDHMTDQMLETPASELINIGTMRSYMSLYLKAKRRKSITDLDEKIGYTH